MRFGSSLKIGGELWMWWSVKTGRVFKFLQSVCKNFCMLRGTPVKIFII